MRNSTGKWAGVVLLSGGLLFSGLVADVYAQAPDSGWFGFANSPNLDREKELFNQLKAMGDTRYTRVEANGDFNDLCASVQKKCFKVVDWQGATKPCNENPNDGSRLALCAR